MCVKRRAAVGLDCALKSQPAGLTVGTFLAAKKVVLHLCDEFKLVGRSSFGRRADNRYVPRTVITGAAGRCARGSARGLVHGRWSRRRSLGVASLRGSRGCLGVAFWSCCSG